MKNPFYCGERVRKEDFVRPMGGGKFGEYSESGKLLGSHPNKAEAAAQLRAIETNKHADSSRLVKRSNGLVPISLSRKEFT